MNRFRQLVRGSYDVILFAGALASVGPLMAWWSVLVRRNIVATDKLLRSQIETVFEGQQRFDRLAELEVATDRQLFMITGESTLAAVLLGILAMALFAVARHRRRETQRLQTMLQLTTHQLKTPLAGVRALLQSLGNGSIPPSSQARFITQGVAECDRLEHLVETTLAYQRTVAGVAQRPQAVEAKRLVDEILEHRRASFPEDEVRSRVSSANSVWCERDAVRVVLENLLDNARKYGGNSVELADSVDGGTWRLEVRDRGQGFVPAEAERLFEPFERGGGNGVAHGSGLGLFLSRQLARRMRGELTASSAGPGQGAVFALELPIAKERAHA